MGTQPRYAYLLLVSVLLLALLVLLQACGRNEAPATETPRAGGVIVDDQNADSGSAQEPVTAPAPLSVSTTAARKAGGIWN